MLVAQHILHNAFGIVVLHDCGVVVHRVHIGFSKNVGAFFGGFFHRPRTTYLFSRGRTCVHRLPYRAMKDCDLLHGVASLSVGEDGGFVSDIRCACAKLLYVTHRASSGWDKTRDTVRGFPTGT